MKKFLFALSVVAMMLVCGCGKENGGDQNHVTCPPESDWAGLVKAHPLFEGFPEFPGRIQNPVYSDLSDEKETAETIVFIVYNCKEDVAAAYYERLTSSGFTKIGEGMYSKTTNGGTYTFSGSYAAGSFALNFSVKISK